MPQQGKDIYDAIQEWVNTKKYNAKSMNNKLYLLEKSKALQLTEFKYLNAMHKMITGQLKEALAEMQNLIKINEDLPYLYSSIAFCQNQLDLKEEAKKSIAIALQKDGNDVLARSLQ
jgi:predicted Zn-dependent protease